MPSDADLDALLGDLYYGAPGGEPERVRNFMHGLGKLSRCSRVGYVRGDFASPDADLLLAVDVRTGQPVEPERPAGGCWFQRAWRDMREGGLFNNDSPARPSALPSRQGDEVSRRAANATSVLICIAQSPQRGAFLQLRRLPDAGPFDADGLRLLRRIAPHLVHAYRLRSYFKHLEVLAAQPTLHHQGMFLLDEQWRWTGGNEIADRMVANGWWRGRRNAPLDANHPVTRARWKTLQQQVGLEGTQHRVIPVRDADGVLVALANVHAYEIESSGPPVARYLLFVRPLQETHADVVEGELRQLFGLTAGESALALSLRKQSGTAHAAAALGIAESSARTRLQSIFEKTNTHCRAELLVLLAALSETVV